MPSMPDDPSSPSPDGREIDHREVLAVLGEEYTLAILDATMEEALSATAIGRRESIPSTTIYRRLDELASLGLLAQEVRVDDRGRHEKRYRSAVTSIDVRREEDDYVVDIAWVDDGGGAVSERSR